MKRFFVEVIFIQLNSQPEKIVQVFSHLFVMFSTGKADQLGVAILFVLITYQTKPFKISGINPEIQPPLGVVKSWFGMGVI